MQPGMKIFSALPADERIELSQGTKLVTSLNGQPAAEHTYVPTQPWRKMTRGEAEMLLAKPDEILPYQSIGLWKMPAALIDAWKATGVHQATTEADILQVMNHPAYAPAVAGTETWALTFQRTPEPLITHRIACIPRNLETVTYNPREKRYLGLHLDSWEKQPLQELATTRNRLCINLGQSPRYFLFVNQEIHRLQQICDLPQESRPRTLIQAFLERFPDYPVIRVCLQPFEAYIAPTENIIHDGSSMGQLYQDVQITIRSYFNVKPAQRPSFLQRIKKLITPN
ncbi:MAG: hypothetical protein H6561_02480 [Lewinellaceae bacterium]|nr:hypothetical protein [Lewinellaceae bacterium]